LPAVALTLAFQCLLVGNAWAHTPSISAEAVCGEGGGFQIDYTTTSWSPDPVVGEPEVDILFNSVVVDSGAYVYPGNSFPARLRACRRPGDSVTVTARS
jgi:hypothetical protein